MNQHVIDWATALRSGEYAQGRLVMRDRSFDPPRHCCLGVAAVLADCPELATDMGANGCATRDAIYMADEQRFSATFLPDWLGKLLQLTRIDMQALTAMNDDGKSFSEIADLLEAWQKLGGAERQTLTSFWHDVLAGRTGG